MRLCNYFASAPNEVEVTATNSNLSPKGIFLIRPIRKVGGVLVYFSWVMVFWPDLLFLVLWNVYEYGSASPWICNPIDVAQLI